MAFLDFIKNREGQRPVAEQQSQQKTETYKEKNTRLDAQEKANAKPIADIPAKDQTHARELGARLDKATQHIRADAPISTPAPDSGGGKEALRQNMTGQDKEAPALSPTDAQMGKSAADEKTTQPQKQEAPAQDGASQQKTMARPSPSWERQ
jgi:hypothetical protein